METSASFIYFNMKWKPDMYVFIYLDISRSYVWTWKMIYVSFIHLWSFSVICLYPVTPFLFNLSHTSHSSFDLRIFKFFLSRLGMMKSFVYLLFNSAGRRSKPSLCAVSLLDQVLSLRLLHTLFAFFWIGMESWMFSWESMKLNWRYTVSEDSISLALHTLLQLEWSNMESSTLRRNIEILYSFTPTSWNVGR